MLQRRPTFKFSNSGIVLLSRQHSGTVTLKRLAFNVAKSLATFSYLLVLESRFQIPASFFFAFIDVFSYRDDYDND